MTLRQRLALPLIALSLVAGGTSLAQEPAPPAEAPASAPAQARPIGEEESPVIQSLMESQPTTPSELVHTASLLVDLRRPELAKPFVQQLVSAQLDEPTLAGLAEEFGTATFLKLALPKPGSSATPCWLPPASKRRTRSGSPN
jgi:hypothetical protein